MRIQSVRDPLRARARVRDELDQILSQLDSRAERPCAGCERPCGCAARSPRCCCSCSRSCPEAPQRLSSDPERHPIEAGILPLVYALACLRQGEPCWSCEGHAREGGLVRPPQVWFFATSAVLPDLIARALQSLAHARRLRSSWEVALCPHSERPEEITFALRPAAAEVPPSLDSLRADVITLGDTLVPAVRERARAELAQLSDLRNRS